MTSAVQGLGGRRHSILSESATSNGIHDRNPDSEQKQNPNRQDEAWHYVAHRPPYPASLWAMLTAYHEGQLRSIHDVGCGPGNGAEALLTHLERAGVSDVSRVILSDPSPECIAMAQARFDARPNVNNKLFVIYHTCSAETPPPATDAPVDMAIACQSLQWTNLPIALHSLSSSLRPSGTLMALLYSPFPHILFSESLADAFAAFVDEHVAGLLDAAWMDDVDAPGRAKYRRGADQMCHGLESAAEAVLRMNSANGKDVIWRDVRLIEVNCQHGWDLAAIAARLGARRPERPLLQDAGLERVALECEDWRRENVTLEGAREMLLSVGFGFGDASWESPGWRRLEGMWGKGMVAVEWQVHVLMARRD